MIIREVADIQKSNLMKLARKYKNLGERSVSVGIHKKDNKTYPDSDVTTAEVGAFHEFGTVKMPPRIWLRIFNLLESEKDELREQIVVAFNENEDINMALNEIGAYMKDRIKDRILSNEVTPPSKKSGTTLVDTGQLVNSINYEVHDV